MITVIFGLPASGKTFFANKLSKDTGGTLIHTDDYIPFGFEKSIDVLIRNIAMMQISTKSIIVEGVQCARLLRRWASMGIFPDKVYYIETPEHIRAIRYQNRGKEINAGFEKNITGIWKEWKTGTKTEIITI